MTSPFYAPICPIVNSSLYRLLIQLNEDEQKIVESICKRLVKGRTEYGLWEIKEDQRDYKKEALEEVYDALTYCAAQLIKEDKN